MVNIMGDTLIAVATGVSYQWIDCISNNAVVGATNQNFIPANNGSYAVILTNSGCVDTSSCINVTIVGVERSIAFGAIKAYPNPTSTHFVIELPRVSTDLKLKLLDASGRLLRSTTYESIRQMNLDVEELPSGIYFIELIDNKNREVVRMIKE
jgi:hypothetical protein